MTKAEIDQLYRAVGILIRQHRKQARLTQAQLADAVKLARTSITNVERGRQHLPLHQLFGIAGALGISPEELLPSLLEVEMPERLTKALPFGANDEMAGWVRRIAR